MPRSKHTLLPLLVVLFLVSYGLMAMLVVEQGRTIDSQRYLIRQLFSDSTQLTSMKGKEFQKQRAEAQAKAQAKAQAEAQGQAETPSTPAGPQDQGKPKRNSGKLRRPFPKPPRDAGDTGDERRASFSI